MSTTTRRAAARSPRARAIPREIQASKPDRVATTAPAWFRLPDGSRSAQSPWVWRGMLLMSLVALGFCLSFAVGHRALLAAAWGVITLGWFGISMWLWKRHLQATR
ncbi:MAG: hypothetical protein J2P58_04250 [Acidimicrobiaceae bacterium]|nr:hypothetical protein [Acidimicrobiaceae bacterium]